ncbi:TolB family protein [Aquabacterium sp. OR-4]|uniref:TolB family protein n=1 Tax=Aquabacterium sp. OR-4 TaxID=2978127 RepID=UPI0028C93090|nr:hypothetical protein [Aquabacterium sp. OR-4]MDT7837982.1 hypothetical protein [Aquabacterium sp. OR-4]
MLAGCGGGGGGGDAAAPSTPSQTPGVAFTSYQKTTLPGRLLMNAPLGSQAVLLNLTTGQRQELPHTAGSTVDSDEWSVSDDGGLLLRWNRDTNAGYPLQQFDSTTLQPLGTAATLTAGLGSHDLKLSKDRKYLLAQIDGGLPSFETRLTVLDAGTLATVKRGSLLDGESVVADPQAWLPDGRYVYLVGRKLYASGPGESTAQLLATLDLPANDASGSAAVAGQSDLVVSPDGTQVAFTWNEARAGNAATVDTHVYTARLDGSALKKITEVADATDPVAHSFGSPVWSPDGNWLAFALFVNGATSAPVWPDDPYGGARIIGTTGCDVSPVYVVPAQTATQRIGRSSLRTDLAVRVQATAAGSAQWVSSCSRFKWLS